MGGVKEKKYLTFITINGHDCYLHLSLNGGIYYLTPYGEEYELFESEYIVEQSTELTDICDRQIFAGDIVIKRWTGSGTNGYHPFAVVWNDQHAGFGVSRGNNHWYEVIGNIHENADLLPSCQSSSL